MRPTPLPRWRPLRHAPALAPLTLLLATAFASTGLQAQGAQPPASSERAALAELQATTLSLIEALVEQGLLPRAKADELMRKARAAGNSAALAAAPAGAEPGAAWGQPRNVVRVPYLPETAKAQIKDDIKNEVLATARDEGWADARKLPGWLRSLNIEGDVRVRSQSETFDDENLGAEIYRIQTASPSWAPDLLNTTHDRNRFTVRARLGVTAKASDAVSAGVRIATGATSGSPTSESQTLGNNFNRFSIGLDRAWLRWEPSQFARLEGGRMAVPFDHSDLLFPDDMSLDGVAGKSELDLASGLYGFAVAGAFPLEEFAISNRDKWLLGGQVGLDWAADANWQLRAALGVYEFRNIEGTREDELPPTGPLAGTSPYQLSQYPASVRQKGNTLINLNAPLSTAAPVWGLASKFRPVNLTVGVVAKHFAPYQLALGLDVVKNTAFDLADITRRAGTNEVSTLKDKTLGFQARLSFGSAQLQARGDWQGFVTFRHFERDAWVDAFTDTTWHLGGTNYKGFSIGGQYAFDNKSTLGLRFTSSRNLDDGVRFLDSGGFPSANLSSAPLKIDVLQLEANMRF
ncbi:MAG TPA: putative porin [Ideonella sp.]|nr:putative porin [Ideonella sp.]